MTKYWTVFTISWQNEFIYRLNFILWRLRNILWFLTAYFLWKGIFVSNVSVFGYSQPQILSYVFMVLAIKTLVISAPSSGNIGGEIANGDLSNYLLKPVDYLKYWLSRDWASKLLNMIFAVFEVGILWLILNPEIKFLTDPLIILGFIMAALLATIIYFYLFVCGQFVSFWTPENTWGINFVLIVLVDILSGSFFPLNILPNSINLLLQFTPFPYLIYYPVAIFVGKITGWEMIRILTQSLLWLGIMWLFTKFLWQKGLRVYSSEGR